MLTPELREAYAYAAEKIRTLGFYGLGKHDEPYKPGRTCIMLARPYALPSRYGDPTLQYCKGILDYLGIPYKHDDYLYELVTSWNDKHSKEEVLALLDALAADPNGS